MANAMFLSSMGNITLTEYLIYEDGTEYRSIQQGYSDTSQFPNYVEDTDNINMIATPPIKETVGENSLSTASALSSNSYKKVKVWYYYYISSTQYFDTLELEYNFTTRYVRVHFVVNTSGRGGTTSYVYLIVDDSNNTTYTDYLARSSNTHGGFDNNKVYVTKLAVYY